MFEISREMWRFIALALVITGGISAFGFIVRAAFAAIKNRGSRFIMFREDVDPILLEKSGRMAQQMMNEMEKAFGICPEKDSRRLIDNYWPYHLRNALYEYYNRFHFFEGFKERYTHIFFDGKQVVIGFWFSDGTIYVARSKELENDVK